MASRSLLDRLGVAPDISLGELASMPWSARETGDSLDALVAQGHADPMQFEPFGWDDAVGSGLSFARSRSHPALIRVEGSPVCSAAVVGSARRVGADALLFVAVEGAALRVGSRLLSVEGDRLALDALPSDEVEAQELNPLRATNIAAFMTVARAPSATDAKIAAIFAGCELSAWLADDAVELAERGGPHAMPAALGLVARLFEAPTEDASALLAAVLASRASLPSARARLSAWWKQRSDSEIADISASALQACDHAHRALASLSIAVETDRPELSTMARRWIRERDDLESLRESLAIAGRDAAFSAALESLDRDAATHATVWSELAVMDGDRWRAVSWQQPHLWWSGFGV